MHSSSDQSCVSSLITAASGARFGNISVGTKFTGTTNGMARYSEHIAGDTVRTKYPNVPHPRLICMNDEHEFSYTFSSVMQCCVGIP